MVPFRGKYTIKQGMLQGTSVFVASRLIYTQVAIIYIEIFKSLKVQHVRFRGEVRGL